MKKVFAAFCLVAILFSCSGCFVPLSAFVSANNSSSSSESSSDSSGAEGASSEQEEASSQEPSGTLEAEPLALGEEAVIGDWQISVSGVDFVSTIPNGSYLQFSPEDGNQYAVVSMSIYNMGKKSDTFLPIVSFGSDLSIKLLYSDGYEFSGVQLIGYDEDLHDSTLNPLSSKEGVLVFEVPQLVVDNAEEPLLIRFSGADTFYFKLR